MASTPTARSVLEMAGGERLRFLAGDVTLAKETA